MLTDCGPQPVIVHRGHNHTIDRDGFRLRLLSPCYHTGGMINIRGHFHQFDNHQWRPMTATHHAYSHHLASKFNISIDSTSQHLPTMNAEHIPSDLLGELAGVMVDTNAVGVAQFVHNLRQEPKLNALFSALHYLKVAAFSAAGISLLVVFVYFCIKFELFRILCRRRDRIYLRPSRRHSPSQRRTRSRPTPPVHRHTFTSTSLMSENPLFTGTTTAETTPTNQPSDTSSTAVSGTDEFDISPDSLDPPLSFTDKVLARPKMKMVPNSVTYTPSAPENSFKLEIVRSPITKNFPPLNDEQVSTSRF